MESIVAAWNEFDVLLALGIFAAYFILDILYVYYTLAVTRLRSIAAANTSLLIYLIAAFGVINYVGNFLYIVPMAMGAWFGTFATVYWEKRKDGGHKRIKKITS